MHPNYVLLKIVKAWPFLIRISALCRSALEGSSSTIDLHFVYALQMSVKIVDCDETLCSGTTLLRAFERLLMLQHMLFVIRRTFGLDAANIAWFQVIVGTGCACKMRIRSIGVRCWWKA